MSRILSNNHLGSLFGTKLQAWYRADLGITTVSGLVSAWSDQSAYANDLTQATSGNRMTYVSSALGGLACVRGTAGKSISKLTGSTLTLGTSARAMFAVCNFSSVGVSSRPIEISNGATATSAIHVDSSDSKLYQFSHNGDFTTGNNVLVANKLYALGFYYDGTVTKFFVNSRSYASYATPTITTNTADRILIGGDIDMVGDVYETMYISGSLAQSDIDSLYAYFRNRYGI